MLFLGIEGLLSGCVAIEAAMAATDALAVAETATPSAPEPERERAQPEPAHSAQVARPPSALAPAPFSGVQGLQVVCGVFRVLFGGRQPYHWRYSRTVDDAFQLGLLNPPLNYSWG